MSLKVKSFQCSIRKGFSRIEKDLQPWLEQNPDITLEETKLQTIGDNILYVVLYSEGQAIGSTTHYPSRFDTINSEPSVEKNVGQKEMMSVPSEGKLLSETLEEEPFSTPKAGLSIGHLFHDK